MNILDPQMEQISLPLQGKARLAAVLQSSRDFVSTDTVVNALQVERPDARRLLSRWVDQGLLKRIYRDTYAPVSLAAFGSEQVLEDPWLLVPQVFSPGYIGGWSAAEHWGLTEQLFRGICVMTAKKIRTRTFDLQDIPFIVKQINEDRIFDLKSVWRGQTKVMISSPARTIIDMLDDPTVGGGIRHVAECLENYLKDKGKNSEPELIAVAKQLGNGAVFKRLGFLASRIQGQENLMNLCLENLSQGNAKLDPSLECPRLTRKWRLWVPDNWKTNTND
jgi:predicted transcriptional regulator of viral defense system